jgi:hypothetical protein
MNNLPQAPGMGNIFGDIFGGVKAIALTPVREGTKIWYSQIMKGAAARLWPGFYSLRQAQALGIDLAYYASAHDAAEKALKLWSAVKGKKDSLMKAIEEGARKKIGNQPWFLPFGDVKNDIVRTAPVTQTITSASGKTYNIGIADEKTLAIAQQLVNKGEQMAAELGADFVETKLVEGQTYYVPSAADGSKEKYGKVAETLIYNPSTNTVSLVSNTTQGGKPMMYGLGATGAEESVLGTVLTLSIPLMTAIFNAISSIKGQPVSGAAGYLSDLDPNKAADQYRRAQQCMQMAEPQRTQCIANLAGELLPDGRQLGDMLAAEQAQEAGMNTWVLVGLGSLVIGTLLFSGDDKKKKPASVNIFQNLEPTPDKSVSVARPTQQREKESSGVNSSHSIGMGKARWGRKPAGKAKTNSPKSSQP